MAASREEGTSAGSVLNQSDVNTSQFCPVRVVGLSSRPEEEDRIHSSATVPSTAETGRNSLAWIDAPRKNPEKYGWKALLILSILSSFIFPAYTSKARTDCPYMNSQGKTVYSGEIRNFNDATDWALEQCGSGRLPDVCSIQRNIAQCHSLNNTLWLGIKKETTSWKWVNGKQIYTDIFHENKKHRKRHSGHHGCGLFHSGEGHLKPFHCQAAGPAALCKMNEKAQCMFEDHWCEQIAGHCFCVVKALNWYHARKACEDIDGHLAILQERSHRKLIAEALTGRPPDVMTNNFLWIGLHREDWMEMSGPRTGISLLT